jgi:hypothetical protein
MGTNDLKAASALLSRLVFLVLGRTGVFLPELRIPAKLLRLLDAEFTKLMLKLLLIVEKVGNF